MRAAPSLVLLSLTVGCTGKNSPSGRGGQAGSDTGPAADDTGAGPDTGADTGAPPAGCRATPRPAARPRAVLVSHPYTDAGDAARGWAAWSLSADGDLSGPTAQLQAGRALGGRVAWAPDGSLALAATERGGLSVFAVGEDGAVTVVEGEWSPGFYASEVWVAPSGEEALVVDGNWAENGGGLYHITLDCETGAPTLTGRVLESRLGAALLPTPSGGLLYAARRVGGAPDGDDLTLLGADLAAGAGVDAFGDDEAIVSSAALHPAGTLAVLGDNSFFSDTGNRLAAVRVAGGALEAVQVLPGVEDPMGLAFSPDGAALLVASGFGDALLVVPVDPSAARPLGTPAPLTLAGPRPELPNGLVPLTRGPQAGLVLVPEVSAIRRVRLAGATATDLGPTSTGEGLASIVGVIGLEP